MKTLYHITAPEHLESILRCGIIPSLGANAGKAGETVPSVWLCDERSVPWWKILLQNNTVLEIDAQKADIHPALYSYGNYTEYICHTPVPAKAVRVLPDEPVPDAAMRAMCTGMLDTLSWLTLRHIQMAYLPDSYTGYTDTDREDLVHTTENFCDTAECLDWSVLPEDCVRDILDKMADGGHYTFCDRFLLDTSAKKDFSEYPRLYEKLTDLPDGILSGARRRLHACITGIFDPAFLDTVDTGGFTG